MVLPFVVIGLLTTPVYAASTNQDLTWATDSLSVSPTTIDSSSPPQYVNVKKLAQLKSSYIGSNECTNLNGNVLFYTYDTPEAVNWTPSFSPQPSWTTANSPGDNAYHTNLYGDEIYDTNKNGYISQDMYYTFPAPITSNQSVTLNFTTSISYRVSGTCQGMSKYWSTKISSN